MLITDAKVRFLVGLGVTDFIASLGSTFGSGGMAICLSLDVLVLAVFVTFGYFARKGHNWSFIVGMICYALDARHCWWLSEMMNQRAFSRARAGVHVRGPDGEHKIEGDAAGASSRSRSVNLISNDKKMPSHSTRRIAIIAGLMVLTDQITKLVVKWLLPIPDEKSIIPGFFKFVHWENTGAAWSMFTGRNYVLAIVGVIALVVLFRSRHHFDAHTRLGQVALGLIFGGITGNLIDRLFVGHVTDFLYFCRRAARRGGELGFPAFNVADSAICVGVGLIFILSWRNEGALPNRRSLRLEAPNELSHPSPRPSPRWGEREEKRRVHHSRRQCALNSLIAYVLAH